MKKIKRNSALPSKQSIQLKDEKNSVSKLPDARKINFLLSMQKEIDELNKKANPGVVSPLKEKFYDLLQFENLIFPVLKENTEQKPKDKPPEKEKEENLRAMHDPHCISKFLNEFSGNEILKYLTHRWEEKTFDYDSFIRSVNREWNKLYKKKISKKIPNSLISKIVQFAVKKEITPWSEERIKIGWSSPIIKKWSCEKKISPYPSINLHQEGLSFNIEETKLCNGKTSFADVIELFKSQIRIKKELNSDMKTILLKTKMDLDMKQFDLNLNKVEDSITIFTDVEKLMQAIRYFFYGFLKYPKFRSIECTFRENRKNNIVILRICHKGSYFKNSINSIRERIQFFSGDILGSAGKLLISICDWYIEADFEDSGKVLSGQLHVLPEVKFIKRKSERKVGGIIHNLIFYRAK